MRQEPVRTVLAQRGLKQRVPTPVMTDVKTAENKNLHKECLSAVAKGQVVQLSQVKDMAFSSGPWERGLP